MNDIVILNKPPRVEIPFEALVPLTKEQEAKWETTRVAMQWACPGFTHLLLTLLDYTGSKYIAVFTTAVPTAATDGSCVIVNPEWYFAMPLKQRVFVLAHEIMHCVYNHCILAYHLSEAGKVTFPDGSSLDYDQETMNIAMDLVINYSLVDAGIGEMPEQGHYEPTVVTDRDSFLDAYRKIYQPGGAGGKAGSKVSKGKSGFDTHLQPGSTQGQTPDKAAAQRNAGKWQVEVAAARNISDARGKLPGALDRAFKSILEPKVDWREHLQALAARRLGSGSYDWRRPDRRFIVHDMYAPSRSAFSSDCLVVACDSSGSVFNELDMWLAELSGILEDMRPRKLFLVWCDSRVRRVDELDSPADLREVQRKGASGGGGTSFVPVFRWIAEQGLQPDGLLYLTDLEGDFPKKAPSYPVIWGCIKPNMKAPFGEVVHVPKQQRK